MRQLILVFAMMLAGCSTVTQKQSAVLLEASRRYTQASLEMTKDQLVQLLGSPQKEDPRLWVWEVRYGRENFESLSVEFNSENQVVRIRGRHSRFRWGPVGGMVPRFFDHLEKVETLGYPETSSWEIPGHFRPEEDYRQPNQDQEGIQTYAASFSKTWTAFENACLAGDIRQIERMCDRRVLELLSTRPAPPAAQSLEERLGQGWKAEKVQFRTKTVRSSYGKYTATARVEFELTENGRTHLETICWVLRDGYWKCLNLPIAIGSFPAEIKYPP